MRCGQCNDYTCMYRRTDGECIKTTEIITTPHTGFLEPSDILKALEEKIKKVSEAGTWDGIDVDEYMDEVRGRDLLQASRELVEAVEKYTAPPKGEFMRRTELLIIKDKLKKLL